MHLMVHGQLVYVFAVVCESYETVVRDKGFPVMRVI